MSTILFYDSGLYPYVAEKMVGGFDRVLYYTPWADAFPTSRKVLWGQGIEGVERVNHFWDVLDEADIICFTDIGQGDLQTWLRKQGHHVWGCGAAEILEQDRLGLLRLLKAQHLPHAEFDIAHGMEHLEKILQQQEDRFVKLGLWRGDLETYHHIDWFRSQNWFTDLEHQVGPIAEHLEFVVEEPISGVEVGFDMFCLDGEFPMTCMYGYELKDKGYLGRVVKYEELPTVLRRVNQELSEPLQQLGCRGWMSTEVRVKPDGDGILIDPCMRLPSPPSGVLMEAFKNWPAIVTAGATGVMIPPEATTKYTAELCLFSDWAQKHHLALKFPDEHRRFIKLRRHTILDGVDWIVGMDSECIGYAVGVGNTMEEAIKLATEVAESVEGYELDFDTAAFDELRETIDEGVGSGVNWG